MIANLEQRASHSSMLCVVMITALFSPTKLKINTVLYFCEVYLPNTLMMLHMYLRLRGSMPVDACNNIILRNAQCE